MISLKRFHIHCSFLVLFVIVFLSECDSFSWSHIRLRYRSCYLFASTAKRTPTTTTATKTLDGGTLTTSIFECTNVQASSHQILETLLSSRKTWTRWISPGSLIKTGTQNIFVPYPTLPYPIQSPIKPYPTNPINTFSHRPWAVDWCWSSIFWVFWSRIVVLNYMGSRGIAPGKQGQGNLNATRDSILLSCMLLI